MTKKTKQNKKRDLTVLTPKDHFQFECHQSLDCFTRCCRNITIFLTPYDILRMKNALKITSGDFLTSYTDIVVGDAGLAVIVLRMRDCYATGMQNIRGSTLGLPNISSKTRKHRNNRKIGKRILFCHGCPLLPRSC